MKQKLISRLILGAFATLTVVGAHAGQIQSSSTSIAREVITADTQTITSPSIAYRFFGDIDATSQDQTFQVQFTLASGSWSAAPTANAISITDIGSTVINQAATVYNVSNIGISSTGGGTNNTLWATINVKLGTPVIKQPLIAINTSSNTIGGVALTNTAAARGTVTGLKTVVGDLATDFTTSGKCVDNKSIGVSFKHYTALTSPSVLATDTNANPDEHLRSSSTNALNGWLVFPTNVKVTVGAATNANAKLTTGGNLTFSPTVVAAYVAGDQYVNANLAYLGKVTLSQNSTGYDGNVTNVYSLAGVASGANVNGLDGIATAAAQVGDVEVGSATVKVSATNGFVVGGTVFLDSTSSACAANIGGTASKVITAADNTAGFVTLTIPTAGVNAAFGAAGTNPINVCYSNPGTTFIPSSNFTAIGTIVKAVAGGSNAEQNNQCNGALSSLGGSIKIDVRNYASSAETSGWQSVIRLINPSDTANADVWGQLINQDGKLGNYALLTTLTPRQTQNFTAAQIDAKLAAGTAASAAAGTAAPVAIGYGTTAAPTAQGGAPRLRITSTQGNTLRVQNYLFNAATGQIVEGSGGEGVDFAGTTNRAPAGEGQYQYQDAQSGLNLQ